MKCIEEGAFTRLTLNLNVDLETFLFLAVVCCQRKHVTLVMGCLHVEAARHERAPFCVLCQVKLGSGRAVTEFFAAARSVPDDEDVLALEDFLGLHDVLGKVFAVVADFSPHVVDVEGLGEVVSVVAKWHSLEVERHGSTAFEVTEFKVANSRVRVSVEELGNVGPVLGEVRVAEVCFPFLIVVDHVVSLR